MPPAPRLAPDEEIDGSFSRGPARRPAADPAPLDPTAARFFARFGWPLIEALLGPIERPTTRGEWAELAAQVRAELSLGRPERVARQLEDLAAAIRRKAEGR